MRSRNDVLRATVLHLLDREIRLGMHDRRHLPEGVRSRQATGIISLLVDLGIINETHEEYLEGRFAAMKGEWKDDQV